MKPYRGMKPSDAVVIDFEGLHPILHCILCGWEQRLPSIDFFPAREAVLVSGAHLVEQHGFKARSMGRG